MKTPYLPEEHSASHGTYTSYTIGFVFSIILTLMAYFLVTRGVQPVSTIILEVIGLALVQLFVQLVFFLHLDRESSPRWNLAAFILTAFIVLILVIGSLWIMKNLDYHHPMMSPEETDTFIIHDEGFAP